MVKNRTREIPKILKEIALREFKSKRPDRLEIRRARNTQIFRRGFGPQVAVLSREKSIPYLMVLDYKNEFRVYQITEDARIVGGQNFTKEEFEKVKKNIIKYTNIIYKIIRPKPKEFTIEDLKEQINQDFKRIYQNLSNKINLQLRRLPYFSITPEYIAPNLRFGVFNEKNDIIILSDQYIGKELKIIFYREIFIRLIPNFLSENVRARIGLLSTYCLLDELVEKNLVKEIWEKIEKIPFNLNDFDRHKILKLIKLLITFNKYNIFNFNEFESMKFIDYLLKLVEKSSYNEIFAILYMNLYNDKEINQNYRKNFLEYSICYYFLADQADKVPELLEKLENNGIQELFYYLYELDWIKIKRNLDLINNRPKKLKNLVERVIKNVGRRLIEIKIIPIQSDLQVDSKLQINYMIINKSKNNFYELKLKKVLFKPRNSMKILDSQTLKIYKLGPGESIESYLKFKILRPGKIVFKGIIIECRDENEQNYEFESNELKILIKGKR